MITPGDPHGLVEQQYIAYGPLFTAMRGARWYLTANPVAVVAGQAEVNALLIPSATRQTGHDLLIPVVLGRVSLTVNVTLDLDPAVGAVTGSETFAIMFMHPPGAAAGWQPLCTVKLDHRQATITVPLGTRGGVLVKASVAAQTYTSAGTPSSA